MDVKYGPIAHGLGRKVVAMRESGSSEEQLLGDKRGLFAHPYLIMGNLFDCTSWLGLDKIGRDFSVACLVT